jgi:DNA-binding response OmpR family regulator
MRILCVDDDLAIRTWLGHVLRGHGYEAVICESGAQAMMQVMRGDFDLFIADMNLPDLPGAEVIRATRTQAPSLPVIGVSGDFRAEHEAVASGVGRFLRKPLQVSELLDELRLMESLRGRQRLLFAGTVAGEEALIGSLRREGFVVLRSEDGASLRKILESGAVDVVIASSATARELLHLRRSSKQLANLVVICATVSELEHDGLLRAGASLCLPEPLQAATLTPILRFLDVG